MGRMWFSLWENVFNLSSLFSAPYHDRLPVFSNQCWSMMGCYLFHLWKCVLTQTILPLIPFFQPAVPTGEQVVAGCAESSGPLSSDAPSVRALGGAVGLLSGADAELPRDGAGRAQRAARGHLASPFGQRPGKASQSPLHSPLRSEARGPTAPRTRAPAAPRGSPAWRSAAARRPRAERQLLQGGLHLLTFPPRTVPQPRAPHRVNNSHS